MLPGAVTAQDHDLLLLKESISSLILGSGFKQYLDQSTGGHWQDADFVLLNFRQMFEERIKYLFMVDSQ